MSFFEGKKKKASEDRSRLGSQEILCSKVTPQTKRVPLNITAIEIFFGCLLSCQSWHCDGLDFQEWCIRGSWEKQAMVVVVVVL